MIRREQPEAQVTETQNKMKHTQASIDSLCGHCDFKNDRDKCPEDEQNRIVSLGVCHYSSRDGVELGMASRGYIRFKTHSFERKSRLPDLDAAIREYKEASVSQ